ncbi:hypothetical protein GALMADRAFT_232371 [Galerina marginata CBS 339.88]|uniref:Uncharacterized protein n=1 Tax=Galerina marginata (strain CBS 339.88) TaxID=685588 RepID=A0A067S7L7_GALM3|nr:hypothetical protein GALMADRAFT_232371 [Galerina marginata CBS 339.88]
MPSSSRFRDKHGDISAAVFDPSARLLLCQRRPRYRFLDVRMPAPYWCRGLSQRLRSGKGWGLDIMEGVGRRTTDGLRRRGGRAATKRRTSEGRAGDFL